jgi:monothiol glutaredoxin
LPKQWSKYPVCSLQCGFSHTVVQVLSSLDAPFETLDVLDNEALCQGRKEYSS